MTIPSGLAQRTARLGAMTSASLLLLAASASLWAQKTPAAPPTQAASMPTLKHASTSPQAAAIDALFEGWSKQGSPGASVSVYQGGKLVFSNGYGHADLEAGTPLTARTPIHVASVSKQFTAFAIALLAREGKVNLDADVRTYLPWVPDFGETITVRHLILHTSGLRDQWALFTLGGQDMGSRLRQQQVVNMVKRQRALNFKPGAEYSYSNTGYTLLAEIVQAVSGQTLREFTTERIFAPLGMAQTFFFDDVTQVVPGRANSYAKEKDGEVWKRSLLNYDNVGATSLFTTAEDMAKWAGNFTNPVVGDKALMEQIGTPGTLADGSPIDYAFGLSRGKRTGYDVIQHSGSDASFGSLFVYFPQHDFAVTVLANTAVPVGEKLDAIARLYLPEAKDETPAVPKPEATLVDAVTEVERLHALEGFYVPPYDSTINLEVKDGKLGYTIRRGNWQRDVSLVLRADDSMDDGKRLFQYFKVIRDGAGAVTALDSYRLDGTLQARYARQEKSQVPTNEELQAFVGDYRSEELDITYTVRTNKAQAGELQVESIWTHEPIVLRQIAKDRFEGSDWRFGTVIFQRNAADAVDSLVLHAGRIRNVAFTRVDAN